MNTTDAIALVAVGVSLFSLLFAWLFFSKTDKLSKSAFQRNYRPYMTAVSYAYIKDNFLNDEINVVLIKIYNAPAFVTSKKLSFWIRDNNVDRLYFEHPEYKDELIYPFEDTKSTITTDALVMCFSGKYNAKRINKKSKNRISMDFR